MRYAMGTRHCTTCVPWEQPIPYRAPGDSLSPARYSIISQVRGNARKVGDLTAGEVELRSPPT